MEEGQFRKPLKSVRNNTFLFVDTLYFAWDEVALVLHMRCLILSSVFKQADLLCHLWY